VLIAAVGLRSAKVPDEAPQQGAAIALYDDVEAPFENYDSSPLAG
jgi:hypothetical protein